ncbi:MAG: hypothetical protein CMH26_09125 [Micavibrio sp.]|nr:hypothetical protein [Micavibrio sp.]|tara:strand:+ start:774 stop:1706 length:933 start_codon:yes stop_codon:yes gene_type:complete
MHTIKITTLTALAALISTGAQAQNYDSAVTIYSLDDSSPVNRTYNTANYAQPQYVAPPVQPIEVQPVTSTYTAPTAPVSAKTKTSEEGELFLGAKWEGRVNAGASVQTGNTEQDALNLDTTIKAKWQDKHRGTLKAEYNRESENDTTTENNKMVEAQYDYFLQPQWFTNAKLSFEKDQMSNVDLRTTIGLGLGHQAFDQDDLHLQYIIGPSYLNEDYENGDSDNSLALNWSLDYDQKIWDDAFEVFHEHELLIPTDETASFLFDSKSGIRAPLHKGLVATGEVDFDWNNEPPAGTKEEDITYAIKLGYEW